MPHRSEAKGSHPLKRAAPTGKWVRGCGAGPQGFFAHRAAMMGHDVNRFDARPKPGGLNEYGNRHPYKTPEAGSRSRGRLAAQEWRDRPCRITCGPRCGKTLTTCGADL